MLFFAEKEEAEHGGMGPSKKTPQMLGLEEPLLVGFGSAAYMGGHRRASTDDDDGGGKRPRPTGMELVRHREPAPDGRWAYYQHPDRLLDPSAKRERVFDLYSLGCVLLEIGLWETLDRRLDWERVRGPTDVMRQVQALAKGMDGYVLSAPFFVLRTLSVAMRPCQFVPANPPLPPY